MPDPIVLPVIDEITIEDLTLATVEGTGVFDVLMRANKAHLEQEFLKTRIRGPEYATVYLGSLQSVLQTALAFLLERQKSALGLYLIQAQIRQAELELLKTQVELQILQASLLKVPAEIGLLEAQTAVQTQQRLNLIAEAANIPKQGLILDQQKANLLSENAAIVAKTTLTTQQTANAVIEGTVLIATECVKRAEFDLIMQNVLKAVQETSLLLQKKATETAQTQGTASADSQMGRQNALYLAQTTGYTRDAEQKAAKLLVDTWNARKVSDDTTEANPAGVGDANVLRAINKLLSGVGA